MDFDTLDPNVIHIICRVCLLSDSEEMYSIYSQDECSMLLSDKILQCTNLEIKENSHLPDQICSKCVADLDASYRFRMNCESSDAILQNYLKKVVTTDGKQTKSGALARVIKEECDTGASDEVDDEEQDDEVGYQIEEFLEDPDGEEPHMVEVKYENDEYIVDHDDSLIDKIPKYTKVSHQQHRQKSVKVDEGSSAEKRSRRIKGPKPPQICDICGSPFSTKTELNAHMRRHLGERPYKCDQCDKAFTISSGLRVHMRTHTGEKPYACKYCDTKFSDFGSRNKHERRHTGERPYVCATCGKTFTYSYVLVNHMLTHTGEKKYECSVCGKRFTKSHHLKQHNNVHLREQGLPYTKYVRKKKVTDQDNAAAYMVSSVVTLMTDNTGEMQDIQEIQDV